MFEPLAGKFRFPEAEQRVLDFWQEHDVFGQSLAIRRDAPRFVFYEGPPTANGLPHPGHCLTRAIKDLFPRYKTMRGYLVERKAGWDTHGLPVEIEVCNQLHIQSKEEIEEYGLDRFAQRCIESVFRYTREWEEMTRRLGFWVNLEDAYVTFHQSYVESVWWGLKTLFERGLLYQGHKVVWWWAQGGTALSAGEVGEGYRTVEDPSVYIRFPLVGGNEATRQQGNEGEGEAPAEPPHAAVPAGSKVSLLVWTTTPWTLISNHFAAVGPDIDYSLVHDKTSDEYFYVAAALVDLTAQKIKHELETISTCKGTDLIGRRYVPPFDCYYEREVLVQPPVESVDPASSIHNLPRPRFVRMKNLKRQLKSALGEAHTGWRVVGADFVTLESGTGLVHQAPAYGEVDFELLQQERQRFIAFSAIPLINAVAPDGTFTDEAPEKYRGRWVKDCDDEIMQELRDRGVLLHQELVRHEYPFCPRSEDDPLIQYARKSWFVRTSQLKEEFLKNNNAITWLPEHIQEGRFGDFLRNNVDWALSRERYWGTPLPIWVCEKTGKMEAIGSYDELLSKPGVQGTEVWENARKESPDLPDHLKVHKPYIDAVTYDSPFAESEPGASATGQKPRMRRVPEVIDCWWDAGSMPFAQWGFPHVEGSVETFSQRFPCDFISEAIDQTRGWFYGLLAISTLLFGESGEGGTGVGGTGVGGTGEGGTGVPPVRADLTIRRRNLPHWEAGGSTYFVTFRTLQGELAAEERDLVLKACKHWDEQRMLLHAAAVMPDHVHLLFTPLEKTPGIWWSLSQLLHSVKSHTAHEIARRRGAPGSVWLDESHDRLIRSEADFQEKLKYILENAAPAGQEETYPWLWLEPSHAEHRRDACATPAQGQQQATELRGAAYPHPYRTCIVLGHVMGEDGTKMSKRLKNYPEPRAIFDKYGADAMRWFFFSAQSPWTSSRFADVSEDDVKRFQRDPEFREQVRRRRGEPELKSIEHDQPIRDAQREFLIRLYNVFSFFNIYANIDGFSPGSHEATEPRSHEDQNPERKRRAAEEPRASARAAATGWRPVSARSELDRWITSELHQTIQVVRENMDRFENYPAAGRLNEFVDALSNWYVRRSRPRFWRGEKDQDKWDAYHTLYEVLVTLSKLMAPFTPFLAETIYQNLVRSHAATEPPSHEGKPVGPVSHRSRDEGKPAGPVSDRSAGAIPISVHLCDYPQADEALIDETLAQEMDLVRQIVSLGRAARTEAKLKVRQPLAQVEIILARPEHTAWLEAHGDLIADELNIKKFEFTAEADQYVSYEVKPEFKKIGPKFGKLAPKIAAALGRIDAADARKTLAAGGKLLIQVEGQPVHLSDEDLHIRLAAKPGWSAAQGRAGVVVVRTELTPELKEEGLIRELIHRIQAQRKQQDLAYEARITLYVQGPAELLDVVRRHAESVQRECLAERIEFAPPPDGQMRTARIESHEVRLALVLR